MEIIGKIKLINEEQTFGANGFRKRELVITTDGQYPQMIPVDFIQDKCDLLNGYTVEQEVKISINIQGREWINSEGEAKYFSSIQGWRIEKIAAVATDTTPPPLDKIEVPNKTEESDEGDLPF